MAEKGESRVAVVAAIVGNVLVAVSKFVAGALTGSSAMIAEGIHSLVDTGNGGLVLLGMRRSAQPADAEHPFGHGMELYFWTLIVAVSIFGIGGGVSVYEGILHLIHPAVIENPLPNYIVLVIALVLEGSSFTVAMREFGKARGKRRTFEFIRVSKDPSLFTVVFEDSAALLGLVIAFLSVLLGQLTGNRYLDGGASVLIGLILMGVAFLLARETQGLLIGEGVEPGVLAEMQALVAGDPGVAHVGAIRTMYLGPDDLLVTLDVAFREGLSHSEVWAAIERVESALKASRPEVNHVYIEAQSLQRAIESSDEAEGAED
jgi:cation diffusion facilitator family transporter